MITTQNINNINNINNGKTINTNKIHVLSETSKKEYTRFLSYLQNNNIDYKNIDDPQKFINSIKSLKKADGVLISRSTVKLYLVSTIWYLKNNKTIDTTDKINEIMTQLKQEIESISKAIDNDVQTHKLLGTQSTNFLDWTEILKVYNILKTKYTKSKTSHTTFVMLSCYILICPRRLGDYAKMHVVSSEINLSDNLNYYVITSNKFIFNSYKTASHYKTQTIEINDELKNLLNEYIAKYNITSGSLFNLTEKAIQNRLVRIFKKYTNKSVSVDILRHSYITWAKNNKEILGKENNVAMQMGHSVSMQNDYYKTMN